MTHTSTPTAQALRFRGLCLGLAALFLLGAASPAASLPGAPVPSVAPIQVPLAGLPAISPKTLQDEVTRSILNERFELFKGLYERGLVEQRSLSTAEFTPQTIASNGVLPTAIYAGLPAAAGSGSSGILDAAGAPVTDPNGPEVPSMSPPRPPVPPTFDSDQALFIVQQQIGSALQTLTLLAADLEQVCLQLADDAKELVLYLVEDLQRQIDDHASRAQQLANLLRLYVLQAGPQLLASIAALIAQLDQHINGALDTAYVIIALLADHVPGTLIQVAVQYIQTLQGQVNDLKQTVALLVQGIPSQAFQVAQGLIATVDSELDSLKQLVALLGQALLDAVRGSETPGPSDILPDEIELPASLKELMATITKALNDAGGNGSRFRLFEIIAHLDQIELALNTTGIEETLEIRALRFILHSRLVNFEAEPLELEPQKAMSASTSSAQAIDVWESDDSPEASLWFNRADGLDYAAKRFFFPSNVATNADHVELYMLLFWDQACSGQKTAQSLVLLDRTNTFRTLSKFDICTVIPRNSWTWVYWSVPAYYLPDGLADFYFFKNQQNPSLDNVGLGVDFNRENKHSINRDEGIDKPGELIWFMRFYQAAEVNAAPFACITANPQQGPKSQPFTLDARCSSDQETPLGNLYYRWDYDGDGQADTNPEWTQSSVQYVQYSTIGTKTPTVTVRDADGATKSASIALSVTASSYNPIACLNGGPEYGTLSTAFHFDAFCSEDDETPHNELELRWQRTGGSWTPWSRGAWTFDPTFTAYGTYTVTVEVKDADTYVGSTSKEVHVIDTSGGSTGGSGSIGVSSCFSLTKTGARAISVNSACSTPTGLQRQWAWGDGTQSAWSTTTTATHAFSNDGTFTVTLFVTDGTGPTDSVAHTVSFAVTNTPPVACFHTDRDEASVEQYIHFDASCTTDAQDWPDGLQYAWDWNNDGFLDTPASNQPTQNMRFTSPGLYTVRLKVWDQHGAWHSVTSDVTITDQTITFMTTDWVDSNTQTGGLVYYYSDDGTAESYVAVSGAQRFEKVFRLPSGPYRGEDAYLLVYGKATQCTTQVTYLLDVTINGKLQASVDPCQLWSSTPGWGVLAVSTLALQDGINNATITPSALNDQTVPNSKGASFAMDTDSPSRDSTISGVQADGELFWRLAVGSNSNGYQVRDRFTVYRFENADGTSWDEYGYEAYVFYSSIDRDGYHINWRDDRYGQRSETSSHAALLGNAKWQGQRMPGYGHLDHKVWNADQNQLVEPQMGQCYSWFESLEQARDKQDGETFLQSNEYLRLVPSDLPAYEPQDCQERNPPRYGPDADDPDNVGLDIHLSFVWERFDPDKKLDRIELGLHVYDFDDSTKSWPDQKNAIRATSEAAGVFIGQMDGLPAWFENELKLHFYTDILASVFGFVQTGNLASAGLREGNTKGVVAFHYTRVEIVPAAVSPWFVPSFVPFHIVPRGNVHQRFP